jgi:hypothetical protein
MGWLMIGYLDGWVRCGEGGFKGVRGLVRACFAFLPRMRRRRRRSRRRELRAFDLWVLALPIEWR